MKISKARLYFLGFILVSVILITLYVFNRYQFSIPTFSLSVTDKLTDVTQELQLTTENGQQSETVVVTKLSPVITELTYQKRVVKDDITAAYLSYLKTVPEHKVTAVDVYRLHYTITLENGDTVPVQASLFVPISTEQGKGVFVFGSGTTGLADKCAPSLENVGVTNIGNYENHMISQASQNYAVLFPDYEGFNNSERLQSYFIADTEARVLLGAVEALRSELVTKEVKNIDTSKVFLSGYSQGGHAALAAASQRSLLTDPDSIQGIIGYATANDITALMRETPQLTPYIVAAYKQQYGNDIDTTNILKPEWQAKLPESNTAICIDGILKAYPAHMSDLYIETFATSLQTNSLEKTFPTIAKAVTKNTTFSNLESIPMLLLQGQTDPIVTAETQRNNRKKLCEQGSLVFYKEYPNVNHYQTRQAGFADTQQWLAARHNGEVPAVNCESI